jgi:hypothetical protein
MSTARAMTGDNSHHVPRLRCGTDEMVVRARLETRRRQGPSASLRVPRRGTALWGRP